MPESSESVVPPWQLQSTADLKASVLAATIKLLTANKPVTWQNLRAEGVRGERTEMLRAHRQLIDEGTLPMDGYGARRAKHARRRVEQVKIAGLALLAKGMQVTPENLRARGVKCGNAELYKTRDQLIADGHLPKEADPKFGEQEPKEPREPNPPAELRCNPGFVRITDEKLRTTVLYAYRKLIEKGLPRTVRRLREHGANGSDDRILNTAKQLIDEGQLPATSPRPPRDRPMTETEKDVRAYGGREKLRRQFGRAAKVKA